jgi:hypothetical protein
MAGQELGRCGAAGYMDFLEGAIVRQVMRVLAALCHVLAGLQAATAQASGGWRW